MKNFIVDAYVETRTDKPDLKSYRVRLDDKWYTLCYDCDQLREVYFNLTPTCQTYLMSCRADLRTVSHYYVHGNIIKRYENGLQDRIYTIVNNNTITCVVDVVERVYKAHFKPVIVDQNKLYTDLILFLDAFNKLNMSTLFSPKEPNS